MLNRADKIVEKEDGRETIIGFVKNDRDRIREYQKFLGEEHGLTAYPLVSELINDGLQKMCKSLKDDLEMYDDLFWPKNTEDKTEANL
jgi:hypothetical protein